MTAPSPGRELSRTAPYTPAGLGRPSELPVLRAYSSSRGELSEAVAAPSGDTSAGGAMPRGSPSGLFSSLPSPPREHARAKVTRAPAFLACWLWGRACAFWLDGGREALTSRRGPPGTESLQHGGRDVSNASSLPLPGRHRRPWLGAGGGRRVTPVSLATCSGRGGASLLLNCWEGSSSYGSSQILVTFLE